MLATEPLATSVTSIPPLSEFASDAPAKAGEISCDSFAESF